ncbi:mucin-7-like [Ambystoma mexicanum]|uniref:mucin-7-like n=1 Tax=Ambystoma mexicanum TaxID=8296 RepID=UPI0037E70EBF
MDAYSSDDPCLHDSDLRDSDVCPFEEDSTQDVGPVHAPSTTPATTTPAPTTPAPTTPAPTTPAPTTPPPTTPAPTNTFEACLSRVEARQEAMLDLMRQYIADGEDTRRAIAAAIAGTTTAIGETTAAIAANTAAVNASAVLMRDCLGAVPQVLTSILLHKQRPRLGAGVEPTSDTSSATTPASSVPASPVRMTRRSTRHSEMPPPDNKKARK